MQIKHIQFSIIIVTYNAESGLEKTLDSIISQTYSNYEVIVVDGLSSDNTLSLAGRYDFERVKIISEEDAGIYDAMNKGIRNSVGDYLYFINSADYLYSNDTLLSICDLLKENDKPLLLYGDIVKYNSSSSDYYKQAEQIDSEYLLKKTICHQSIFANRNLFEEYGLFDTSFKIRADYVWLANLILMHKVSTMYVNKPICYYSISGISSTSNYWFERLRACRKYYSDCYLLRYKYLPWIIKRIKKMVKNGFKINVKSHQ